jgi:formylglycine-generating enzyme required for sulfatase activity
MRYVASRVRILRLVWLVAIVAAPARAEDPVPPQPQAHRNYTETIPGTSVRFDMVAIPGGTFRMGSPPDEKGRGGDEGPQHPVAIRPFWMGKLEISWDEYNEFRKGGFVSNKTNAEALARNPDAITRPTPPYPDETRGYGKEGYPAIGVSHHAAMEYCYWLSKKTGKTYRLPTEAEWEYACRAGTTTAYSFGNDPKDLDRYAWFVGNSNETPHPVGRKAANRWGLHDMEGNVAEWCIDLYRKDAYTSYSLDRPTLGPVILPTAALYPHVARGGSWDDPPSLCRSAARCGSRPEWNAMDPHGSIWWVWDADFVGFRIVRPVEEQANLNGLRSQVRKTPN